MKKKPLTIAEIVNHLAYDPETGIITWKITTTNAIAPGSVAGNVATGINGKKYIIIQMKRFRVLATDVAWVIMTGKYPNGLITHRDDNGINNQWCNLSQVSIAENRLNKCNNTHVKRGYNNKTGYRNVLYSSAAKKYYGSIMFNKTVYTTRRIYETPPEASVAVEALRQKLFGENK